MAKVAPAGRADSQRSRGLYQRFLGIIGISKHRMMLLHDYACYYSYYSNQAVSTFETSRMPDNNWWNVLGLSIAETLHPLRNNPNFKLGDRNYIAPSWPQYSNDECTCCAKPAIHPIFKGVRLLCTLFSSFLVLYEWICNLEDLLKLSK